MSSDDRPVTPCRLCGAPATGPCARCRAPICPDCCELTEGSIKMFAVCKSCARTGATTFTSGWRDLVFWVVLVGLGAGLLGVLFFLMRR
jgi:hypothetical protein